jgi:hypothetical protein
MLGPKDWTILALIISLAGGGEFALRQDEKLSLLEKNLLDARHENITSCSIRSDQFADKNGDGKAGSYRSHFNRKLNRCFVEIFDLKMDSSGIFSGATIYDTYELNKVAEIRFEGGISNQRMMYCILYKIPQRPTPCASREEYLGISNSYMQM